MPLLVASKDKAFTPEAAAKAGKPVVLVLNGIHPGEPDGKDACLILLRDMALGNRPDLLDTLTLLVVPIYNVDGHERVSKWNRPNQDGPVEGMGFRTTTQGYDLNRDFLKADAPETRALLSLVAAWNPDLFVDDHVTDGSDAQATLTVSYGGEPATPEPLRAWLETAVRPALAEVEEAGWKTAPYIEWVDPLDPAKGIDIGPTEPRYGTGYMPLRGIPSILVEMHALKPYGERVRANAAFLSALLARVGREPEAAEGRPRRGRGGRPERARRLALRPRRRDGHLAARADRLPRLRLVAGRLPRHRPAAARLRPGQADEHPDARLPPREGHGDDAAPRGLPRPRRLAAHRGEARRARHPLLEADAAANPPRRHLPGERGRSSRARRTRGASA